MVVSATKSMTGHLLGGAGAVESIAAVLALRDRVAPPTINLEDPDDQAGVDIATEPRELHARGNAPMAVLNNSFGFGGHNVALAFIAASAGQAPLGKGLLCTDRAWRTPLSRSSAPAADASS